MGFLKPPLPPSDPIRLHDLHADRFRERYHAFEEQGRFASDFAYGRFLILRWLELHLPQLFPDFLRKQEIRIVDVGSGTGHTLAFLQKRFPSAHLLGIEPSERMRQYSCQLFPQIPVQEGRVDRLPLASDFADVILTIEVFRYLDKQTSLRGYREIFRVLRPGGIWIFTHVSPLSLDGYPVYYLIRRILTPSYHYTRFVLPGGLKREIEHSVPWAEVHIDGIMLGWIRPVFRLLRPALARKFLHNLVERIYPPERQVWHSGFCRLTAGTLIGWARKPPASPSQ